jgi:hypothetical protein
LKPASIDASGGNACEGLFHESEAAPFEYPNERKPMPVQKQENMEISIILFQIYRIEE